MALRNTSTNGNPGAPYPEVKPAGMRALSYLLSRVGFANKAGLAYQGQRDYDSALGYLNCLSPTDYRVRYERGGVAKRVVRIFPESTWEGGAVLIEDEDPDITTDFEEAFASIAGRLSLWSRIMRADILSGIGRFGVLLIGAPGRLEDPLPQLDGPDEILYFHPYSEESVQGIEFEDDPESPRFSLPVSYQISIGTPQFVAGGTSQVTRTRTRDVHWTRVLHIADELTDNDIYGEPRMRAVWNYLDDLLKVVGGGSEASWKRADPGLWIDLDKDLQIDEKEEEALDDEVSDYLHSLTRVVRTRGANLQLLQSQVAGFGSNAEAILKLIASTIGVPLRIFIGSEMGELASTQDRRNFSDRVSGRRNTLAEPLIRELVGRLSSVGALPPVPAYRVVWADIEELDEREKSEVAGRIATANLRQTQGNLPPVMTADEIRDKILGLKPADIDTGESSVEEDDRPDENMIRGRGDADQRLMRSAAHGSISSLRQAKRLIAYRQRILVESAERKDEDSKDEAA